MGPKLADKIGMGWDVAFLDYKRERVEESFSWRVVKPKEVEELCWMLVPHKGLGWSFITGYRGGGLGDWRALVLSF